MLFFSVMGAGGRALRGSAFASVLSHSSLRRSPPIPNAVVLSTSSCSSPNTPYERAIHFAISRNVIFLPYIKIPVLYTLAAIQTASILPINNNPIESSSSPTGTPKATLKGHNNRRKQGHHRRPKS